MAKQGCLSKEDVGKIIRGIAQRKTINQQDPAVRVDVWKVQDKDILEMLETLNLPSGLPLDSSKRIAQKLNFALERMATSERAVKALVDKLKTAPDAHNTETEVHTMRAQAIGLKEVMDSIEGEINKAFNHNVEIETISPDGGIIPFLPTHRLAASIGRKVMYLQGYRFTKAGDQDSNSTTVEYAYYAAGMKVLNDLADNGFLTIHPPSTKNTIKDYQTSTSSTSRNSKVTMDMPAIELNVKALGIKDKNTDRSIEYFTNRSQANIDGTPLDIVVNTVNAINLLSQPQNVTFPAPDVDSIIRHQIDAYTLDGTMESVRRELEKYPTFIDKSLHGLFKSMHDFLKKSDKSASRWLKEQIVSDNLLSNLFQIERHNPIPSDQESFRGRNLSKTTPIDDLIEYYDKFYDRGPLHMALFGGRNARLYYENSVVNPHYSKAMRHSLTVKPYTMSNTSEDYYYHVDKVARVLGMQDNPADLMYPTKTPEGKNLTKAIGYLNTMERARTPQEKIKALKKLSESFPELDFAQLVTTVSGARDIRKSKEKGATTITTSYAVTTDATASGASITLHQALGANPEGITKLLKQLGVFKGSVNESEKLRDIYAILQKNLKNFVEDVDAGIDSLEAPDNVDVEEMRGTIRLITDVLFDGKAQNIVNDPSKDPTRDLSKDPTMTFIYDQTENGAVDFMATTYARRLLKKLKKPKVDDDTLLLLNYVRGVPDEDLAETRKKYKTIIRSDNFARVVKQGFKDTGMPKFLYGALTQSITQKYLEEYKLRGEKIFKMAQRYLKNTDLRVYPASAVLDPFLKKNPDFGSQAHLKKYGIPMSKIFEVLQRYNGTAVLNRQGQLRESVMNVSFIHGVDTANEYHGLKGLPTKHNSGVVVVHDSITSKAPLVREAEAQYRETNKQVAMNYDIHEQVLLAIGAYYDAKEGKSDARNSIPGYTELLNEVRAGKAKKKEILESNYDNQTSSIIGDNVDLGRVAEAGNSTPELEETATSEQSDLTTQEEIDESQQVEEQRQALEKILNKNPEKVLTYDIETSGTDPDKDFIVQIAYRQGNNPTQSIPIKLTADEATRYLNKMGKVDKIRNSAIYKAIKASHKKDATMREWNKNAVSRAEAVEMLNNLAGESDAVVSFKGKDFDDLFTGVETTHDLQRMVHETTQQNDRKGKLVDFVNEKNAHDAAGDVDMTHELMSMVVANKLPNSKKKSSEPKEPSNNAQKTLEKFKSESRIIRKFLQLQQNKSGKGTTVTVEEGAEGSYEVDQNNREVLTIPKDATKELIEHEIVHALTDTLIRSDLSRVTGLKKSVADQLSRDVQYIGKTIKQLSNDIRKNKFKLKNPDTLARITHIMDQGSLDDQISEFVAVMATDAAVAKEIYSHLGPKEGVLKRILRAIRDRARTILSLPSVSDMEKDIDVEKVFSAVSHLVANGETLRADQANWKNMLNHSMPRKMFYAKQHRPGEVYQHVDFVIDPESPISALNASLARYVTHPAQSQGESLLAAVDGFLKVNYPLYRKVVRQSLGLMDHSEVAGLWHKISNENIDNPKKNKVQSLFVAARRDKNELTSEELKKFKAVMTNMTDADKKAFFDFTHKMAIQDYFVYAENFTDIDAAIRKAEADLPSMMIPKLRSVVDLNVNGVAKKGTYYNIKQVLAEGTNEPEARAWVALTSIKEMGVDRFNKLRENEELMKLTRDITFANKAVSTEANLDQMLVRDNLLMDEYSEKLIMKVVRKEDLDRLTADDKSPWKVASMPTDKKPGLVYQPEIDNTYQEGVFADLRMHSADITVPSSMAGMEGVIRVGNQYKYVIDNDAKKKMGVVEDASQALVRSFAHNYTIQSTNVIRDLLLEKESYWDMNEKGTKNLEKLIKDPQRDHPWFLGKMDDTPFEELPPTIKRKYMAVPKRLSNVGGENSLDSRIAYVRKDIAYWLVGTNAQSIAKDPKLKWALRITKNVVAAAKIGMVIVNPQKIAADNFSNINYLGVLGIDPLYIQKQYRAIAAEYHEYKNLRNQMIDLKVKSYADPKKYKARIKALEQKLKEHPANGLVERGFISSLGSDLVMNTDDPSSGFKGDIDKLLTAVFKDGNGKNNTVGQFLMNFSNTGVGMEDFLESFGKLVGFTDATKDLGEEIRKAGDRIKTLKSQDDVVAYLHQFLNSPDSEFVKLGSYMTDLTDILARETYYRYLVDNGVKPVDAEVLVIDSFPDYKEGLPLRVKQLNDVGILMFPNYWLRIQKAIYRMAKNRPASLSAELAIEYWMGINAPTIFDQGIWFKLMSDLGIVNNPFNLVGPGAFVPTRIAG